MTAAGIGLTLTAASSVLFAELHWTPGVLAQCEDRCHRIGQKNAVNVMYCICKDETLSVDMRLWAMLGRKVGTLGRVIDGCKTASMNASESDGSANPQLGESVEEELTRFFAKTSTNDLKQSKAAPIPVKGSILSFFKPPLTSKAPQPSAASATLFASKPPPAAARPMQPVKASMTTKAATKQTPRVVEWSCKSCTFDNSSQMSNGGWLSCDMCGTSYIEEGHDERKASALPSSSTSRAPLDANRSAKKSSVIDLLGKNCKPQGKRQRSLSEVIVIDMDKPGSEDTLTPRHAKKPRRSSGPVSDVIEIDIDCESDRKKASLGVIDVDASDTSSIVTPSSQPRKRAPSASVLSFVVSKNSGRISLHCAKTGNPLHHNFDIDQLVTEETSDVLLNAEVKRSSPKAIGIPENDIRFHEDAVNGVVCSLNLQNGKKLSRTTHDQCRYDITTFVRSYLSLREVEKKALKEWDKPVSCEFLKQTVAQIMTSSTTNSCTERYVGGAKEGARANAKAGIATALDNSVLAGTACAWCAGILPDAAFVQGVECTYCSQECAEQGRLGRGGMHTSTRVRAQVFGLEGGVCQKCGIDAHALFVRISALEPPERLNALINAKWQLPRTGPALDRLLQKPSEGDFWQADHTQAVAEGGGACGLDNLQTLCTPCHRAETDKLRSRLRLTGGPNNNSSRNQMDIRSAFLSQGAAPKKMPLSS